MTTIEVFDLARYCATAVRPPRVDLERARFEADLRWLAAHGTRVARYNLAEEPGEFSSRPVVAVLLRSGGEEFLPIVLVDGKLCFGGTWPSRADLIQSCEPSETRSTL
jgi:Arsenical resistance operon protein ArsD